MTANSFKTAPMALFKFRGCFIRLAVLTLAGLAAGCSVLSPKPDFARYYQLNSITEKTPPAPPPDPTLALAVFPVDVAGYLDRPQMVTLLDGGQVKLDEYHRWAESLDTMIARVLAQDVGFLADSSHVAAFPLAPGFDQEFEVYAQIQQFDGPLGGNVTLRVSWRITGLGGKPNYVVQETTSTRHADAGADPAVGYVNALNGLVGDLARQIVSAMPEARAAKAAHPATAP
jgi:uncharacterized protein